LRRANGRKQDGLNELAMTAATPEISVVVPCHNEQDNLRPLVAAIRAALDPLQLRNPDYR
jgi:hypothetical protein